MKNSTKNNFSPEPLQVILGNGSAYWLMLFLYHYGQVYPSQVATALNLNLTPLRDQCKKFSDAGILNRKVIGRSVVYSFNQRSPLYKSFYELIASAYKGIPEKEKTKIFGLRTRSRKEGKEVISNEI